MNSTPEFHSSELRRAVTDASAAIDGLDEGRNRVSKDIKSLEAYLRTSCPKETFRYCYMTTFESPEGEEQYLAMNLDFGGSASGYVVEEALLWGTDNTGKVRLLHEYCRWEGYVDVDVPGGPYFRHEGTLERQLRPLIETPFESRKEAYKHLPAFVRSLGQYLEIDRREDPVDEDPDLPF